MPLQHALLLLAQASESQSVSPIEELEPPVKAALLMALLGIILLGFFLVLVIMLGARWVRRLGNNDRSQLRTQTLESLQNERAGNTKRQKTSNNDRRQPLDDALMKDQETLADNSRSLETSHDGSTDSRPGEASP